MKKIFGTAVIALAVLSLMTVAATDASANCAVGKAFGQILVRGSDGVPYHYVTFDFAADNGSVIGRFWQPGARSTQNEGTYDDNQWLNFFPGNIASLAGDLATSTVAGCPTVEMIVLIQATVGGRAQVAVGRVNEQAGGGEAFAYNRLNADMPVLNMPIAKITSKSKTGNIWTLDLSFDDVAPLFHGRNAADQALTAYPTISGYRLMVKKAASSADDSRLATSWSALQACSDGSYCDATHSCLTGPCADVPVIPTASNGGTKTGVKLDCGALTSQDYLLGVQLSFDNGQFLGDLVSQASAVKCSGLLAEPGEPNFKIIDRKTTSPRPIKK